MTPAPYFEVLQLSVDGSPVTVVGEAETLARLRRILEACFGVCPLERDASEET